MKTRRYARLAAGISAVALVVAACSASSPSAAPTSNPHVVTITPAPTSAYSDPIPVVNPNPTLPPWTFVALTDVNTGQSFKVSDFAGKVVLVETMATWCPTCQGEMSQVQQLDKTLSPNDFVSVTLDVDPNEDAALLKKYAQKNGFTWRIAIAPIEVGRFLSTNYDEAFLNPPLQPMLIVDRKGGMWGLPTGIKSAASLEKTLAPYISAS